MAGIHVIEALILALPGPLYCIMKTRAPTVLSEKNVRFNCSRL
jgi:hypothetical protein